MQNQEPITEKSQQHALKDAACDFCGKPATRWFGQTSIRICDSSECREYFQRGYEDALNEGYDEE